MERHGYEDGDGDGDGDVDGRDHLRYNTAITCKIDYNYIRYLPMGWHMIKINWIVRNTLRLYVW